MGPRNEIREKYLAQLKRVNDFVVKGGTMQDYRAQVKKLQRLERLSFADNKLGFQRKYDD
ncbi:hypothetical protein GKC32_09425 [Lactobacillus curvatus]|nr:hypothetical protein [Latilactobacillus curvatus]MSD84782.1 hypothetical protein [Latilactobacillus curvatus]MSE24664.1 hypothetical protein [Latilactobacillus curvatus]